jgi:predicted ester cyclase
MSELNKAIVRRYREIHNNDEMDKLEEVLAPDFVPHSTMPGMPWNGLESAKQIHLLGKASFPDMSVKTEDLIAEGDKVVERWTQTQTHTGAPFMGIPPSAKPIVMTGMSIYRIANGKIVEHWGNMDFFGMMAQMGAIPTPGI